MRSFRSKHVFPLLFLLWLGLIAGGYAWSIRYGFKHGREPGAPPTLPPSLACPTPLTRAQLILSLHPHCPCSRATVAELGKILSRTRDASDVTVLLYKPATQPDSWLDGWILRECHRLKCRICPDPDGRAAASLGGFTSGHVALYDIAGRLCYQGGITGARGHEGDNLGERTIIELLRGRRGGATSLPVFGCAIQKQAAD
jgi:hypothetical protein